MDKAIFLDRDGIILEIVYDKETGKIHTANFPEEVSIKFGIIDVLKQSKSKGYKNIVISNQPDVGLGRCTLKLFEKVKETMNSKLKESGAELDAEYYCFHHPFATVEEYRKKCDCRKPEPGMLLQAAKELDINLGESWMVGDGVNDIIAGNKAGCKTILVADIYEAECLRLIEKNLGDIKPTVIVRSVKEIGVVI